MRISELSAEELTHRLGREGLTLRIGPFTTRLQSSIPQVVENFAVLYDQYPTNNNSTFVDFNVRLAPPKNLRRWFRPQVMFLFDGRSPFNPLPMSQAFPLFEWGLNWCVANHANKYLIVHAAVVEKNGYAVIMAAPPEAGKSTLCAGLVARGWRLLSDELALISTKDGSLTPVPRPVSLKNASIDLIRNFVPGVTIGPESYGTSKGVVAHRKAPDDSIKRADEPAVPAWLVCPRFKPGAPARMEQRSKAQTFMYIIKNAFNYNVHGLRGYRTVASLIDRCGCYDFTYSCLDEAVSVFEEFEPPRNCESR